MATLRCQFPGICPKNQTLNVFPNNKLRLSSVIGGYAALGGHLEVLMQPFEFVIICGASLGVFIIGNPFATIKDSGKAFVEAIKQARDDLGDPGAARPQLDKLVRGPRAALCR